jgi:hypothetical protein
MPPKVTSHPAPAPFALTFEAEGLRHLVVEIVAQVLAQLEADRAKLDGDRDRLAFSEEEAARLIGLEPHQLRDERRRGRIAAATVVGRRIRYTREHLLAYLTARTVQAINGDGR